MLFRYDADRTYDLGPRAQSAAPKRAVRRDANAKDAGLWYSVCAWGLHPVRVHTGLVLDPSKARRIGGDAYTVGRARNPSLQ